MNVPISARASERPHSPGSRSAFGEGRATAKVILFGEHAVVYGAPALAAPVSSLVTRARVAFGDDAPRIRSAAYSGALDRAPERVSPTVTALLATLERLEHPSAGVRLEIESDIPVARGLGSSAAVASAIVDATAAALGASLTEADRHELVQTAERAAHGSPSGLDARAVRADGPVWFRAGEAVPVPVGAPLHLVIADTGVRGRTRLAVEEVAARRAVDPDGVDAAIARLGTLTFDARAAVAGGDISAVGRGMDEAQRILTGLGVGHPALDHLAVTARGAGALGAKLTGGGQGGCLIALGSGAEQALVLADALRASGAAATWITTVEATT